MTKALSTLLGTLFFSLAANATVVEIRTVLGNVQVNLFDERTPETVQNFLEYVNSGAYANNVVHRSVEGFVVQAGGFQYNGSLPLDSVPVGTPVTNEPELSNVRGTIAMAKLPDNPNSATSQWFINLSDNSQNLDVQNGGFTAFGQVIGDGMDVIDSIAALQTFNTGGDISSIPLIDYTTDDADNSVEITEENLVIIQDIVVVDANTVTNPDIVPVENTLIDTNPPPPTNPSGGSSGGSLSFWGILGGLALVAIRRQQKKR